MPSGPTGPEKPASGRTSPRSLRRLTPPGDTQALATVLAELITDSALRRRLGAAGEARMRADFAMDRGIDQLMDKFATVLPAS